MKKGNTTLTFISLVVIIVAGLFVFFPQHIRTTNDDSLKKFASCQQMENYISNSRLLLQTRTKSMPTFGIEPMMATSQDSGAVPESSSEAGSSDYSTTNIQIEGVDEADIVKNDGKYIYTVSGKKIIIIDAYPADSASIVSEIEMNGTPTEIFINDDRLVVFGSENQRYDEDYGIRPYYSQKVFIKIYDVSDRTSPVEKRDVSFEGSYFDSRMIGDYVYVLVNSHVPYDSDIVLPKIEDGDNSEETCGCSDVYYFDYPDYSYSVTSILAIDAKNDEKEITRESFLLGSTQNIFVSPENIYVTYTRGRYYAMPMGVVSDSSGTDNIDESSRQVSETTTIHKISIDNGNIDYEGKGSVPGWVLNQFSMDENNGYFRIATTIGHVSRSGTRGASTNNVYVLDNSLKVVGKVEDLAPGEQIYSARFMGDRCYMVTFRKIDPLFVIDLSDPNLPKVLGKLKIPGYSDYLHPYDENHIIGIGKEAMGAEQGDFAWYQGVKLSLFDVSDVSMPKEVSKYEIGDRGTDSNALHDHKAFLFSKSKGIIVIPITLAEINEEQYPDGVSPSMHGDFTWQGAYVLNIDLVNGITLRGRVSHIDDEDYFLKSGHYFYTPYSVKRSLYIGDNLYTLSSKLIKMNNLESLENVNQVELPYEEEKYYGYPEPMMDIDMVTR